jgi:hypothetical protein
MTKRWAVLGLALLFGAALAMAPGPAVAELKVSVSGYVKMDVVWTDKLNNGGFVGGEPSPPPPGVPLDNVSIGGFVPPGAAEKDHSEVILDAKQTRVRVVATDEVMGVKLAARVEGDFFQADGNARVSNSRHLRLRHAHGSAEHPSGFSLLFGQTWTTFMNDEVAQPDLVDFNGPVGQIFNRQPQVRLGWKMGDLKAVVSVEKHGPPEALSGLVAENQGEGQDVPLVVGKAGWYSKMVQVEGAGAFANSKFTQAGGSRINEANWAAQFSAQVNFGPASVYGHYQHVSGLQRLLNGDFADMFVTTVGGATFVNSVITDGYYVGGQYRLTPTVSFNAVYGYQEARSLPADLVPTWNDRCVGALGSATCPATKALRRHQSVHVNVLYKFWQRLQAGLEYRRIWVDTFNGPRREGDQNIVHGALWFFF